MYRNYMGPRGRRIGHRGFIPGIFAGIIGLAFGGWIVLLVLGSLLGAGVSILYSMVAVFGRILSRLVSTAFTSESFAAGVAIGLIWTAVKRMKEKEAAREAAAAEETGSEEDAEPEIIETPRYTFHA